jgi:hypothetical protein
MRRHIYIAGSSPEPILAYSNVDNDIIEIRIKHGDNDLQVIEIPCIDFNLCPNVEYQYIYRFRADGVLSCNDPTSLETFETLEFAGKPWLGSAQPNINITYNADGSNICTDPDFINFPGTKVYSVNLEGETRELVSGSEEDRVVNPIMEGVDIQRYNDPSRDLYDCADNDPPPGGLSSVVPPSSSVSPTNPKPWAVRGVIQYATIIDSSSDPSIEIRTSVVSTSSSGFAGASSLPFELSGSHPIVLGGSGGPVFACNSGDLTPEIGIGSGFQTFSVRLRGKDSDCTTEIVRGRSALTHLNGTTFYACRLASGGPLNWVYSDDPSFPGNQCAEIRTFNPPTPIWLEAYIIHLIGGPINLKEYYRVI